MTGHEYDKVFIKGNENGYDFILVFATSCIKLNGFLSAIAEAGKYDSLFWICYP